MNFSTEDMLKYFCKAGVIFNTIISYFFLTTTIGFSQSYQDCYMINSSGQVVTLNNLCNRQDPFKARACEGPFDSNGFPLSLAEELGYLEKAIGDAQQSGVRIINAPNVQSSVMALLAQMPFPARIHSLLYEQKQLIEQLMTVEDSIDKEKIRQKFTKNSEELASNKCLSNLIKSLYMKFPEPLIHH